jgi:hypothetical protein
VGTPVDECGLAMGQSYNRGIPEYWLPQGLADYYTEKMGDIPGKPVRSGRIDGNFNGVAIAPDNPPLYESEATYLKRHGLLAETEEKHLKPTDFVPERVDYGSETLENM